MDRGQRINEGEFTIQAFFTIFLIISYNLYVSWLLVFLTNVHKVNKSVVLLEGIYFALAHFLHTHDNYGTRWLVIDHIVSIIPIFTKLRILSCVVMTAFATLYPRCLMLTSMVFISRVLTHFTRDMPFLMTWDTTERFPLFLGMSHIVHYYMVDFHLRSLEDVALALIMLYTLFALPNILGIVLALMVGIIICWIELKAFSLEPRSTFPRLTLHALSF